jgi:hypothetical protein
MQVMAVAAGLVFMLMPSMAAAQKVSVNAAAGVTIPSGSDAAGNVQSVSGGYSPTPKLTVLVTGARLHRDTSIRNSFVTRGGTVKFVGGEVQYTLRSGERVSPYAAAGMGVAWSQPNVNQFFPQPATNDRHGRVIFAGGGVAVPVTRHVRLTGDMRFLLFVGQQEALDLFLPLRAGIAWRF